MTDFPTLPTPENIRKRLFELNQNWLSVFTGRTGSGKSFSAIHLAAGIDPNFCIDNVVFTPKEFLERLNSGELKKGSCVVFDEAGVGMAAREWSSIQNKLLSYVLQTFRYENLAVIFTVPSMAFVDVHARRLIHSIFETLRIDRQTNEVICKYLEVEYSPREPDHPYFHFARVYNPETMKSVKITRLHIGKPPQSLIDKYEAKKQKYATTLKEECYDMLKAKDDKAKKPEETKKALIIRMKKQGVKMKKIAELTGFDYQYVRNVCCNPDPLL
jgi:hypothetical protein